MKLLNRTKITPVKFAYLLLLMHLKEKEHHLTKFLAIKKGNVIKSKWKGQVLQLLLNSQKRGSIKCIKAQKGSFLLIAYTVTRFTSSRFMFWSLSSCLIVADVCIWKRTRLQKILLQNLSCPCASVQHCATSSSSRNIVFSRLSDAPHYKPNILAINKLIGCTGV